MQPGLSIIAVHLFTREILLIGFEVDDKSFSLDAPVCLLSKDLLLFQVLKLLSEVQIDKEMCIKLYNTLIYNSYSLMYSTIAYTKVVLHVVIR